MFQLLAQYQNYIYGVFITVEVLRYLYGSYTIWRNNQHHIRRMNAAVELFTEVYSTVAIAMIRNTYRPLSDNARIAFNVAVQPNTDLSVGMWTLMNALFETVMRQYGLLRKLDEANRPVPMRSNMRDMYPGFYDMRRFRLRQVPKQQADFDSDMTVWKNSDTQFRFNTNNMEVSATTPEGSVKPAPTPETPSPVTTPTPVTEHPLQQQQPEKPIYDGMELASAHDSSDPEPETVKRPRFGIASANGINMSY